jgi:hypothetical protein
VELGEAFGAESVVEGTVIGFSDSGRKQHVFAVVEVDQRLTMVVAMDKLSLLAAD